nr:hypothetical protein [uncultured Allomuricauda sp.]
MKKTVFALPLATLVMGFSIMCRAQAPSDIDVDFPKQSFLFNSYGDKVTFIELQDMFLSIEEREEQEPRIDTIRIVKRLSENDFIITERSNRFALMHREILVPDSIVSMGAAIEGKSVEEIESAYKKSGIPSYAPLRVRYAFSAPKIAQMEKAPGLDKVKREDLIASLSWRPEIGDMLKVYLEQTGDGQQFRIMQMVQNFGKKKLVDLGYNPYRQVVYNWHKQFADDEEVMQLLDEPISFD